MRRRSQPTGEFLHFFATFLSTCREKGSASMAENIDEEWNFG
jgi:hypothetical protein